MFRPSTERSLRRYPLALSEETRFQFLHPNQLVPICTQLIPWWHDLGSFRVTATSSSKFWCKHMPPNFGIKVILSQNYRICIPNKSTVTGRESWSRVYHLLSSMSAHEPMLQNCLLEYHRFTGTWIHLSRAAIKCLSDPSESTSQFSYVSLPYAPSSASDSAGPSMVYPFAMKILSG